MSRPMTRKSHSTKAREFFELIGLIETCPCGVTLWVDDMLRHQQTCHGGGTAYLPADGTHRTARAPSLDEYDAPDHNDSD